MNALSETRNKWGLNIFFLALAWIFAASLTIPILPLFYIDPPYFTVFVISAVALILLAISLLTAYQAANQAGINLAEGEVSPDENVLQTVFLDIQVQEIVLRTMVVKQQSKTLL